MRRVRFRDSAGMERVGEWTDRGIEFGGRVYDSDAVAVLPPVRPTKVVGIGANNPGFVENSDDFGWPDEFSDHPRYVKTPNCVIGHGDTATLPAGGHYVYELEFGVVVGEHCRDVPEDEAMDVVLGFTCYNDITDLSGNEWLDIKAFDNAAPIGPVVASPDSVPEDAGMELRVDGAVEQRGDRSAYIDPVPKVVHELSKNRTLEPGDVLSVGTASDELTRAGDGETVELEIEGIGTLEHRVEIEPA